MARWHKRMGKVRGRALIYERSCPCGVKATGRIDDVVSRRRRPVYRRPGEVYGIAKRPSLLFGRYDWTAVRGMRVPDADRARVGGPVAATVWIACLCSITKISVRGAHGLVHSAQVVASWNCCVVIYATTGIHASLRKYPRRATLLFLFNPEFPRKPAGSPIEAKR